MKPNQRQVISLMPEIIQNEDGMEKQDCEGNAAKRAIPKLRKAYPQLGIIIMVMARKISVRIFIC